MGLEAILGFRKSGDRLTIRPSVPASWPSYTITLRYGASSYEIHVVDPARIRDADVALEIDGQAVPGDTIVLVDDGARHVVRCTPPST